MFEPLKRTYHLKFLWKDKENVLKYANKKYIEDTRFNILYKGRRYRLKSRGANL